MRTVTIQNQVIDLLQWSSSEYEERRYEYLTRWGVQHGKYPSVIQQLLANSAVNRWFNAEFEKLEIDFLRQANVCRNRQIKQLESLYMANVVHIFTIYPSALTESIKKNPDYTWYREIGEVSLLVYAN